MSSGRNSTPLWGSGQPRPWAVAEFLGKVLDPGEAAAFTLGKLELLCCCHPWLADLLWAGQALCSRLEFSAANQLFLREEFMDSLNQVLGGRLKATWLPFQSCHKYISIPGAPLWEEAGCPIKQ